MLDNNDSGRDSLECREWCQMGGGVLTCVMYMQLKMPRYVEWVREGSALVVSQAIA